MKIGPVFLILSYPQCSIKRKEKKNKNKQSVEYKSWLDKCRSLEASCVNTDTPAGPDNQIRSNSCQTTQQQPRDIVVSWPTKFPDWVSGASRTSLLVRTMHHESRWSSLILKFNIFLLGCIQWDLMLKLVHSTTTVQRDGTSLAAGKNVWTGKKYTSGFGMTVWHHIQYPYWIKSHINWFIAVLIYLFLLTIRN